ncbi:MAG: cytochrome c peroxidase, partial [Byssovorax sp.]
MTQKPLLFAVLTAATLALAGCPEAPAPTTNSAAPAGSQAMAPASASAVAAKPLPPMPTAPALPATPEGLPELKVPADNALTAEKVMLGKQLFFDKRLSRDGSASCETCHVPEKGWTDGTALSKKVGGAMNVRHSPTMINVGYNDVWYWDGRADTLEKNVEAAWKGQLGADPAVIAAAL